MNQFDIPILFLVFNRPDTTRTVFEVIRQMKPAKLYVAADGARAHKAGEAALCEEVLNIVKQVDWECEVKTLFREQNLGCKVAVSEGISWFFSEVEYGIILEDDCLPHPSFFTYCGTLLKKYANDERVMSIAGTNFLTEETKDYKDSYFFSNHIVIWGWASWRRAWAKYDRDMKAWPALRASKSLPLFLEDKSNAKYWMRALENTYNGTINTWDYQWSFSCWMQNGLSIVPKRNLISNIGIGNPNATHTVDTKDKRGNLPVYEMQFPLSEPATMQRDFYVDQQMKSFYGLSLLTRIQNRVEGMMRAIGLSANKKK
jgi:hypothetical protein